MKSIVGTLLELLRIVLLLLIVGGLIGGLLGFVYSITETAKNYQGFAFIGILLVFFVLYRNKFQFSGWYRGKGRKKLPKRVSHTLLTLSGLLFIFPFVLSIFFG